MYVRIGPYPKWIGPYQVADSLFFFLPETWRERIGDAIPLAPFEWMEKHFRQRYVDVRIHKYDVWNMDSTLAHIILPMLYVLKKEKQGAPYVDNADVPTEFWTKELSEDKKVSEEVDEKHFARWEWVIDELIWTFEQCNSDWESQYMSGKVDYDIVDGKMIKSENYDFKTDKIGMEKHQKRIDNGLRLFGKYYQGLWA